MNKSYNSPDVTSPSGENRTGKIWGLLVPYELTDLGFGTRKPSPWRAGANENTTIEFSHDVLVQGAPIKAGKYGLHIIVREYESWTLIFSKNHQAWGSYYYNENEDALRVDVKPKTNEFHEWLTFEFIDRQKTYTKAALMWENIQLPFKIEVENMKELYVNNLRKELQSNKGFYYQSWNTAATFCLENDINLEEALTWAEAAISNPFFGNENFYTLGTKAQILAKLGRTTESAATMDKAMNHPASTALQIHGYGRQLIKEGKKDKAMEVFKFNYERFKGAWPTEVGMARGYSALGQFKMAISHAKNAVQQAPDQLNKDSMTKAIEKLENGENMN